MHNVSEDEYNAYITKAMKFMDSLDMSLEPWLVGLPEEHELWYTALNVDFARLGQALFRANGEYFVNTKRGAGVEIRHYWADSVIQFAKEALATAEHAVPILTKLGFPDDAAKLKYGTVLKLTAFINNFEYIKSTLDPLVTSSTRIN